MQDYIGLIGVGANWLPALLGLIGLPLLYTTLATDTHRDYADLVREASAVPLSVPDMRKLLKHIEGKTQVFALDWWVVGAIGVLLFAIMSLSNLQALCVADAPAINAAWKKDVKGAKEWGLGQASSSNLKLDTAPPMGLAKEAGHRTWGLCSGDFKKDALKAAMSLYAALFAILVGFRLIWARLVLARELKGYHARRFKVPASDERACAVGGK